jgi:secondary thiamine-phosphate synthase enzyme
VGAQAGDGRRTAWTGRVDLRRCAAEAADRVFAPGTKTVPSTAMWMQREIRLAPRARGFHLVTREVLDSLPEIVEVEVGLLHLLIQHTSASLTLNENASPDVRRDFETWFSQAVPEQAAYWTHVLEGDDDMPAHVKAALLGPSLTLPVSRGRLALGTWQGIYLCEHRNRGGPRTVIATLHAD